MATKEAARQQSQYQKNDGLKGAAPLGKASGGDAARTQQGQYKKGNAGIDGGAPFGNAKQGESPKPRLAGTAYDGEQVDSFHTTPTDMGKGHELPAAASSADAQSKKDGACTSLGTDKAKVGGGNKFC